MADFEKVAAELTAIGRRFDARGWLLGTSGTFSAVIGRARLGLALRRSGVHKVALGAAESLGPDDGGAIARGGPGLPSAETRLHLGIVAARQAGAVMHTHSIWGTFLSDRGSDGGGVAIE